MKPAITFFSLVYLLFSPALAFLPSPQVTWSPSGPGSATLRKERSAFATNIVTRYAHQSRRRALSNIAIGTSVPFLASVRFSPHDALAAAASPIADLPMIRLQLPPQAFGREYVVVQLKVNGQGPFDFMVDSGLTTEMISPHLQQTLGITPKRGGGVVRGLSAGGDSSEALLELDGVSLCCGEFAGGNELKLPPLHAVVTDFPQEHIDPKHNVEGMVGMELLDMFDSDFDFDSGRLRLWSPGTAAGEASKKGMVTIPDAVLNDTGLLGIRVTSTTATSKQPVVGILDCGASFSCVNWEAAKILGLPPIDDSAYRSSPAIMGVGVDGRALKLPTHKIQFTYVGTATTDASGHTTFEDPPSSFKAWDSVTVGIGDLPVFSQLLGDGRTPYNGPAVLLGLDVLPQRRVILETGRGRARKMYVDPK